MTYGAHRSVSSPPFPPKSQPHLFVSLARPLTPIADGKRCSGWRNPSGGGAQRPAGEARMGPGAKGRRRPAGGGPLGKEQRAVASGAGARELLGVSRVCDAWRGPHARPARHREGAAAVGWRGGAGRGRTTGLRSIRRRAGSNRQRGGRFDDMQRWTGSNGRRRRRGAAHGHDKGRRRWLPPPRGQLEPANEQIGASLSTRGRRGWRWGLGAVNRGRGEVGALLEFNFLLWAPIFWVGAQVGALLELL
jgi:hypothetical protein